MICPYCHNQAIWVSNEKIYGRRYGKSYMVWLCKDCDAYVGCHNNTHRPLGTMANAELRKARNKAHAAIDPLWKSGKYPRPVVYAKLKKYFGREIHVGESDLKQCQEIIDNVDKIFKRR